MYKVFLKKKPEHFLRKLDKSEKEKVIKNLEQLGNNPEIGKPLVGKLSGLWSLRMGKYRAIYQIKHSELIILVLKLGHRKKIYGK
jgi:mRNA interferase RelE/StbE